MVAGRCVGTSVVMSKVDAGRIPDSWFLVPGALFV